MQYKNDLSLLVNLVFWMQNEEHVSQIEKETSSRELALISYQEEIRARVPYIIR